MKVENFGLAKSTATNVQLKLTLQDKPAASFTASLPALAPYEVATLKFQVPADLTPTDAAPRVEIAIGDESSPSPAGHNRVVGVVRDVVYLGATTQVRVDVGPVDGEEAVMLVQIANQAGPRSFKATPGERVACWFSPAAVQVLRRSEAGLPDPVDAALNTTP